MENEKDKQEAAKTETTTSSLSQLTDMAAPAKSFLKSGADWVNVKLTKFGAELAGGGELHVHGGRNFTFKAGTSQRVTKAFDWEQVLANEFVDGEPLFELVEKT